MTRRWLYRVVALGTVFGVAAVARHLFVAAAHGRASGVCLFHAATGAPCPACGMLYSRGTPVDDKAHAGFCASVARSASVAVQLKRHII